MLNFTKILLLLISCSIFTACSDDSDSSNAVSKKDHVWKEQTDTIDKAKEVEAMLMKSTEAKKNMIEDETQ